MLKALWTRLLGQRADPTDAVEDETEATEHRGYRIRATPYAAAGGYQTAGVIEKDQDGGVARYEFVRAETHPSRDDAAAFAVRKAMQIIDEQGDKLFLKRSPQPPA